VNRAQSDHGSGRFVDRRSKHTRIALETRVEREFDEMPGLRITVDQAARLFGIERSICVRVLETLSRQGTLSRDAGGRFVSSKRIV